jgi:defect-in-organelle-trafficking protein DotD
MDEANRFLRVAMRVKKTSLAILSAVALLAACEQMNSTDVTPIAAEPDIVTVKLTEAADRASRALDGIANIEQTRSPATPPLDDITNAPNNLMQPITLRWSGPIEPMAKTLADRAGMRFRVTGYPPTVPITVSIDAYQQPLIHVLRDIGLQAGRRADVAIDGPGGVIEIRYAPPDKP